MVEFGPVRQLVVEIELQLCIAQMVCHDARGRLPGNLVFEILGLRTLDALTILLPLALFIGVLLAYGRLWRDSEMAVLQGVGLPLTGLLRPLTWLAAPVIVAIGLICSGWRLTRSG